MNASQKDKALQVDMVPFTMVVVIWWLASLLVVRALLAVSFTAPLLEWIQHTVPVAGKIARNSGFGAEATAFYLYFLITSPIVAFYYFRYTTLVRNITLAPKVIMGLMIPYAVFMMSIGMEMGPENTKGFRRSFNLVLTSSWFGSSFIYLLFCHCALICGVCLIKDRDRKISG